MMKSIIKQHKIGLIAAIVIGFALGFSIKNLFMDYLLGGSMF